MCRGLLHNTMDLWTILLFCLVRGEEANEPHRRVTMILPRFGRYEV